MLRLMWGALAAVALSGAPAAAQLFPPAARIVPASYHGGFRPPAQQIACESWQFRRQTCPADTRGGVRLLQQTGGICTRGQTWGYTREGLWVTNGCRGIFAVVPGHGPGFAPPSQGRLIVCESWRFQPARCAAAVHRRPRIEVIAGSCLLGRTWGWSRGGVWVNGGCRARFLLG